VTGRRERWFYALIAPWLIGLVGLQLVPLLTTTGLALSDWTPPAAPSWVGLDNLAALATDPRFLRSVVNTLIYTLGTVLPGLAIGLGLALLFDGLGRAGALARTIVFLPAVLAGVATALLWGWILNPRVGLLDALLGIVGIDGPSWLRDPAWAMPAVILVGLWSVGINVIVYAAALGAVPRAILEAAMLDGAGRGARFRHVTWPALTPITFYLLIVGVVGAFGAFTSLYVLTGGGPQDATLTTAIYTYETAFAAGRLGFAAAMTVVAIVVVLFLTAVQVRVGGRRVAYLGADG
jgi:multiple sugar transport system permease protein